MAFRIWTVLCIILVIHSSGWWQLEHFWVEQHVLHHQTTTHVHYSSGLERQEPTRKQDTRGRSGDNSQKISPFDVLWCLRWWTWWQEQWEQLISWLITERWAIYKSGKPSSSQWNIHTFNAWIKGGRPGRDMNFECGRVYIASHRPSFTY